MTGRLPVRWLLAGALLVPLVALVFSWVSTHRMAQQGTEWLIPVRGYDPRDLLRGHYVQYSYDWPWAAAEKGAGERPTVGDGPLCVTGMAPHITSVRLLHEDGGEVHTCAIIIRAATGTRPEVRGLESGIFFASQPRAIALSRQLADSRLQGMIRVRVRKDGLMRPIDMEFRPAAGSRAEQ